MRQSISVAGIDDSRLTKAWSWGKIIVAKLMIYSPAPPDMDPPFVAGFVFVVSGSPCGSSSNHDANRLRQHGIGLGSQEGVNHRALCKHTGSQWYL